MQEDALGKGDATRGRARARQNPPLTEGTHQGGGRPRLLIADGSSGRRSAIKRAAEADGTARVVGEADNGAEAVRLTRALLPDVVLLRLELPNERDGVLVCRELKNLPEPPLVVLYGNGEEYEREGLAYLISGADGFACYIGEGDLREDGP